jgi:hypothetical protein
LHSEFVVAEAAGGKVVAIHQEVDRSARAEIAVELQERPKRTISGLLPQGQIVLNQARPSRSLLWAQYPQRTCAGLP